MSNLASDASVDAARSGALVLFGVTGDLAYKKIFSALYAMVRSGALTVQVGKEFIGEQRELYLCENWLDEELPYERLLSDAMTGDSALFTDQGTVEAAWAVVDPVLTHHNPALPYPSASWSPPQADALIARDGGWYNPASEKGCA